LPEAIAKCPHAIFVKRDFAWYNALSNRFHAFMRRVISPECEEYSVDEAFFVMPQYEDPATFALKVRDQVKKFIGLPVTVGLGRSKTLAKLISDTAKPFGARAVITEQEEHAMLAKLAISEVSGIAGRRTKRLEPYGIKTCFDYISTPVARIRQILTVEGAKLWNELRGDPVSDHSDRTQTLQDSDPRRLHWHSYQQARPSLGFRREESGTLGRRTASSQAQDWSGGVPPGATKLRPRHLSLRCRNQPGSTCQPL
jgi:nucleotidyltransferase/DNA polymerase involved in DNA repair